MTKKSKLMKMFSSEKKSEDEKEEEAGSPKIIVRDKRFWVDKDVIPSDAKKLDERLPTYLENLKVQLGNKDTKLQEVILSLKDEQQSFKKRIEKDIENQFNQMKRKLISNLLPASGNLDRAIESAENTHNFESLMEGIKMVNVQFKQCLKDCGAEEIDTSNRAFDPKTDEAVQVVPVEDKEKDNVILACLEPGYRLGDKIIQPAKVKVGKFA